MASTITSHEARVPPLLERDRELEVLGQATEDAAMGRGSLVIVEGPAGIGKTRLLDATAARASEAGFLVRRARGGEMEREMPFGVVRQLLEPAIERATEEERDTWLSGSARHGLVALGHASESPTQGSDTYTVINGLYWLVANLTDSQPVTLVIDDAQWSDSDSLRFASFLARRISDLPALLVIGSRVGEAAQPAELDALRLDVPILRPQPLSASSVRELIASCGGSEPTEDFTAACVRATSGNPFLVVEIVREVAAGGGGFNKTAAESIAELAPEKVARTILFRLGRFGDEAIVLARAIAILGRAPHVRHAAQLADLSEAQAVAVCDRLRQAEILAPGVALDFVHPLVRQAIYKEQSEGVRVSMHRRAAEILSSGGGDAQEVAAHLLACPPTGDQWVVDRLREAAEAAISDGAQDGAAIYLERALAEPPQEPLPILVGLGAALVEFQPFRAPQFLVDALPHATDRDEHVEVLRRLVWANISVGNLLGAADTCDEALEVAGDSDRELVLGLEAQRYFLRGASLGIDAEMSARIEAIAGELTGQTNGERVARQALAIDRFTKGLPVDEVVALCLPFPEVPWEVAGLPSPLPFGAAKILAWSGAWDEARRELSRFSDYTHDVGWVIARGILNSFASEIDRLSGRLVDAEAQARTAWEIAESAGRFTTAGWSSLMNLVASLVARGDLDGFEALIGDFDMSLGPLEIPLNPWPIEIRAYYHRARGDLEPALADLFALAEGLERVGWLNPVYPAWRQEATEILAALGRASEATELIEVGEERARAFGSPQGIASVLRARSFIETRDQAIESLRESVETLGAHGAPHELARSLLELGAALRRDGQRNEAREPLQRALELAHRSGARLLENRAREELRTMGSRPRQAYRTGVGSLTASELRTARLVAEGLNNREVAERLFVSRRTVETHLTHAYEKLGIEGRAGLAGALTQEGSAAP